MTENLVSGQLLSPIKTLEAVQTRLTEAVIGRNGFNHPALVAEIRKKFNSADVDAGAIAQEPIIEAAFPYVSGDETLNDISGGLLHPKVVNALTTASAVRQYSFPRELKPYAHQIEAWRLLRDPTPQSVLVTSGTGSGKTECFVVPLLDDLARDIDQNGRLSGVRAIALYPLNALIASQEERLREWTAPFKGDMRFGLYNGLMPDDMKSPSKRPEQVEDRCTLRSDPPPILVTNITMLEYMTVRKQDRPVLEASQGKLRWIILDEAHSYIGSQAAEVALLIRRVLLAFGVKPTDVRFVATSATIGEGEDVEKKLKAFLRDVAGLPDDRVHVVVGQRRKPILPAVSKQLKLTREEAGDPRKLAENPVVQNLVKLFDSGPMRWSSFSSVAAQTGIDGESLAQALAAKPKESHGEPLLPIRAHGFIRGVSGLWTCLNPNCSDKAAGWPFGAILPEAVQRCPHCRSAVVEVERCSECGEPYLVAIERAGYLTHGQNLRENDEFAADSDQDRGQNDDEEETIDEGAAAAPVVKRLIAIRELDAGSLLHVEPKSGAVKDGPNEQTIVLSSHDYGKQCPACGEKANSGKPDGPKLFQTFRSGAPFLIGNATPVLLDGVAPRQADMDPDAPIPDGGRQLLSFTDSRQGTARFAASLQNGSERNFIRAAIYHAIQHSLQPQAGNAADIAKIESEIEALEGVASIGDKFKEMLAEAKQRRDLLINPSAAGIAWDVLRRQLAGRPEVDVLMRNVWRFRDERFLNSSADFTEFLMLREMARRPRLSVALETLGLAKIRYSLIENLGPQSLPAAFKEKGRSIDDYRDFLRVLLSTVVRASFAIRTPRENIHWFSGVKFQKYLTPPGRSIGEGDKSSRRAWPHAGGQAKAGRRTIAVLMLERVLALNPVDGRDRCLADEVLQQAWNDLLPLFAQAGDGANYALDFNKVHVAPVKAAFICPVTRRLTDLTFGGFSPSGFGTNSKFSGQVAEQIDLPLHPNPFLLSEKGGAECVQTWLREDEKVQALRDRGLWDSLHDRIALASPYFRAAEHSAQQPPMRLRHYEREFKAGRINVLNCSTTMEMGVDIGSVSIVMMTNVPPSVANYKQRVGRAGRRGQGFALSLTYARPTPLDRETFRDPVGYLNRKIEAPKVSLDSKRIVQRHINALLLAKWFQSAGGEAMKTKVGGFFGCSPDIGAKREGESAAALFQKWAQTAATANAMADAVKILVKGSALADDPGVFEAAAAAMKSAENEFVTEWNAVQAQAASMAREVAKTSLGFQLKRMCGESLLGELADRGVLPGHGFPTDVVSFVNKDQPDKDESDNQEDSGRFRRRNYPSRNLDLAIRDYAPGAQVVIDGLVYESAGVTLNWKRPAGESDISEIQSLKWFWECSHCGDAGTSVLQPNACATCGGDIRSIDMMRFLRPAGFTVDMTVKPDAEIDEVRYIEPEPDRVSARGAEWTSFIDSARGRIRSSRDGMVYFSSKGGKGGLGYSVCLYCGRAEADATAGGPGHKPLNEHRPLRFTRADADGRCPGNDQPFLVQSGLGLGHEISTDVVEIQPIDLEHSGAAWALGSALREALARRLGIGSSELGVAVGERMNSIGGVTHSIYLFDRASGGAGFAPRLTELFAEVLRDAKLILDCKQPGCVSGCSSCVLTSDLGMKADLIDRKKAFEFLDRDLAQMSKPEPADEAADGALLSVDAVDDIVSAASSGAVVTIWPSSADFDPASLASSRMRYLIDRLARNGAKLRLSFSGEPLSELDASQKLALRDAAIRHAFELITGSAPKFRNDSIAIAAVAGSKVWSSRSQTAAELGERWGRPIDLPIVSFDGSAPMGLLVNLDKLLPASGTRYIEIGRKLDGPSNAFGEHFIQILQPELANALMHAEGSSYLVIVSGR